MIPLLCYQTTQSNFYCFATQKLGQGLLLFQDSTGQEWLQPGCSALQQHCAALEVLRKVKEVIFLLFLSARAGSATHTLRVCF